jgi:hypothetical protein
VTETGTRDETSIVTTIAMTLARLGRAAIGMAKGMDTTSMMTGGEKSDIDLILS